MNEIPERSSDTATGKAIVICEGITARALKDDNG